MPPSKSPAPVYRYHVSGNAQVRLCGKDFYLGPHGSPESYSRYHALLAEYNANGRKLPESVPEHQMSQEIRVRDVTADFRELVLPRYVDNSGSYSRLSCVLNALNELYGELPISEFGPLRMRELRNKLAKSGNCRRYLNDQVRDVIRIVKHGLSRELVKPETITALEALPPLRRGEARDNPKRGGVPLALVSATLPHVSPVVQIMIRLQLATGCRPSEIFRMTPSQIDRSGDEWIYRPDNHKTLHRGKEKAIPIVGDAVKLLEPVLFCRPNQLCFVNSKGTPRLRPYEKTDKRHSDLSQRRNKHKQNPAARCRATGRGFDFGHRYRGWQPTKADGEGSKPTFFQEHRPSARDTAQLRRNRSQSTAKNPFSSNLRAFRHRPEPESQTGIANHCCCCYQSERWYPSHPLQA